ncbi:hypothetical protein [Virgibacillus dakarensis]|uniref:hypothetical protein n=1 Tax=Virgibacillus dakarensis TaxID=1917889 RepID=UPI001E2F14BE|nr:hypothetical protein [Virgibacillus dakarensis]
METVSIAKIRMGSEFLSVDEVIGAAIQHEGIHQGQYFVALKQIGRRLPDMWIRDWGM